MALFHVYKNKRKTMDEYNIRKGINNNKYSCFLLKLIYMIKINSSTYVELFKDYPDYQMTMCNWNYEIKYYLFGTIAVVIYTKPLIK